MRFIKSATLLLVLKCSTRILTIVLHLDKLLVFENKSLDEFVSVLILFYVFRFLYHINKMGRISREAVIIGVIAQI